MAKTRNPSKPSLSAREQVELRKCALISAATACAHLAQDTADTAADDVVTCAERFMNFLTSGNGR